MKTIIEVQTICYYRRQGFAYFKSLAGDRFKIKQGNFRSGEKHVFRLEITYSYFN
jgi:hypothetical protein